MPARGMRDAGATRDRLAAKSREGTEKRRWKAGGSVISVPLCLREINGFLKFLSRRRGDTGVAAKKGRSGIVPHLVGG
jgi:hypothetical protein